MGKKPVMALAGLCLASTAFVGCCGGNQCYTRQQQPTYHTSPTWPTNPNGQNPPVNSPPSSGAGTGQPGMLGTPVGGMQSPTGSLGQPMSGTQPPMGGLGQPGGALPSGGGTGLMAPVPGNGSTPGLPGRGSDGLGTGGAGAVGRTVDEPGMSGPMPPAPPTALPRSSNFTGSPPAGFNGSGMPPAPTAFPGTTSNRDPLLAEPPAITPDRAGSQMIPSRPLGVTAPPGNPAVMMPGRDDNP
jgi:hypothetical protein